MQKALMNKKVAVLVTNGFDQSDMLIAQKTLIELGAIVKIISPEQGLVTGWKGVDCGHSFAVDAPLNTVLGADYDILIVPGGQKSQNKLKLTAHSKRFIDSFMGAMKPVVFMNDGVMLGIFVDLMAGRTVAAPSAMVDTITSAGVTHSAKDIEVDGYVMTGLTSEAHKEKFTKHMTSFLIENAAEAMERQAA